MKKKFFIKFLIFIFLKSFSKTILYIFQIKFKNCLYLLYHYIPTIMTTFRVKNKKFNQDNQVMTLDVKHHQIITTFKKTEEKLPEYKIQLSKLEENLEKIEKTKSNKSTSNNIVPKLLPFTLGASSSLANSVLW